MDLPHGSSRQLVLVLAGLRVPMGWRERVDDVVGTELDDLPERDRGAGSSQLVVEHSEVAKSTSRRWSGLTANGPLLPVSRRCQAPRRASRRRSPAAIRPRQAWPFAQPDTRRRGSRRHAIRCLGARVALPGAITTMA